VWDWSKNQIAHSFLDDEWSRLGDDKVPYGQPLVEFKAKNPVDLGLGGFVIDMTDSVPAGDLVTFTVTAVDPFGSIYPDYNGTVNFSCTDAATVLPANYTFVPSTDYGSHTFLSELQFWTEGAQQLSVTNVSMDNPISSSKNVTVLRPGWQVISKSASTTCPCKTCPRM